MKRKPSVVLALALVAAIATGVIAPAAFSATAASSTLDTTYTAGDEINVTGGPTVNFTESYTTSSDTPKQPPDTIDLSPSVIFESQAETFAYISQLDEDYMRMTDVDASKAELNVTFRDKTLGIENDLNSIELRNYGVDDGREDVRIDMPSGSFTTVDLRFADLPTDTWVELVGPESQPADYTGANGEVEYTLINDIGTTPNGAYTLREVTRDDVYSNASPASNEIVQNQSSVTLSVDIDAFAGNGNSRTVEFYRADGTKIGDDTVSKGIGTANVTYNPDLGPNKWYAVAGGLMQSEVYEFGTPNTLEIREEQSQKLLNDTDIDVSVDFFVNSTTAISRTATNGTINLKGLPTEGSYIIEANAAGDNVSFEPRQIYIEDVTQAATLYLLNTSKDTETVDMDFVLDDRTGDFESGNTRLIIQRPFNVSSTANETTLEYRQLIGEQFGAGDRVSATLEQGIRYQLLLQNDQGVTRELSTVIAERSELVELTVGSVDFNLSRTTQGVDWGAKLLTRDNGNQYIRVYLRDTETVLEDVTVKIYASEDPTNFTLRDQLVPGEHKEIIVTQTIPSELDNISSWTVEWNGTRNNETIAATTVVGSGSYPVDVPIPDKALGILSALLLTFIGGFFSVRVSEVGVIVVPVVALGLYTVGWLPLPLTWILAALTMGVSVEFASRGGFSDR